MTMSANLFCTIENETHTRFPTQKIEELIEEAARRVRRDDGKRRKMLVLPFFVTLYIIGPDRSRALNKQLRGKDEPADVLSLEYPSPQRLGEIFVCPAIVRKHARAEKRNFEDELAHVVVHGVFHVFGVHHEKSTKVEKLLWQKENAVLKKLGYKQAHQEK